MSIRSLASTILDKVIPKRRAKREKRALEGKLMYRKCVEMEKLYNQKTIPCDTSALGEISQNDLNKIFGDQQLALAWQEVEQTLGKLHLSEMTGGVNPGDQRVIYYLVSALKPKSVLEIGTHIGCSLVNIALAAKRLRGLPKPTRATITTVDITDVNNPAIMPWLEANAKCSPKELIDRIGCIDLVTFVIQDSLEFLGNEAIEEKFDFIFLDGSHEALQVYREIPAALKRLNQSGFILLHDYFPDLEPLWSNNEVIPGVRLAVHRLENEGARITAIPLGELPWPIKLDSNVTSLALLSRAPSNN